MERGHGGGGQRHQMEWKGGRVSSGRRQGTRHASSSLEPKFPQLVA